MKSLKFSIRIVYLFFLAALPIQVDAQEKPGIISLGAVRTELEASTVRIVAKYAENLPNITHVPKEGNNWLLTLSPDVKIETGEKDAFNGIIAKAALNFIKFKMTTLTMADGKVISTPDSRKLFWVFPVSVGGETNNRFDRVNGLIEGGVVPWYQNAAIQSSSDLTKQFAKTKFGAFVQGGYKFDGDNSSTIPIGGATDESDEVVENSIFRVKAIASYRPEFILDKKTGFGLGLIGDATYWYDIVNSENYYRIEGAFRIILKEDRYFDLTYQKGSGAPNFNEGEQFSANLTIGF